MKTYLVGGYVRDKILGLKNHDKDYVVINSNIEEMEELGFKSVGKSFPVFIHKDIEGEFALARSEKKIGNRHYEFEFFTENISLEEDLSRRDFTINALALDEDSGEIIDYFNGLEDIKSKIIRPVSIAFCEDPLRVLRAARFKALLGDEWSFDKKLYEYTKTIKDELKFLSRERVYQETKKALHTDNPELFFLSLKELDVLDVVFPWLYRLIDTQHNNEYHLEGSVFNHTMMALKLCKKDINAMWSVLFHDTGKFNSFQDDENFYRHSDKKIVDSNFLEILETLTLTKEELGVSKFFTINHHKIQAIFENSMRASKIANLLFKIKNEEILNSLLIASLADMRGRVGKKKNLFFSKKDITNIYKLLKNTNYNVDHKTMSKDQIVSKVSQIQSNIIKDYIKNIK